MFLMAVATRIDALAVGVTFAFLEVAVVPAVLTIGVMTFLLSMAGVRIGHVFGARYQSAAEIIGGVILCALGIKILSEQFF
jgi:putative Mn2+ efflux pump MntP